MSDEKAARLAAIRAANAAGQAAPAPLQAAPAPLQAARPADDDLSELSAMPLRTPLFTLLAVGVGVFAAVVALPTWLPGLSASLLGAEPKAYWYLSRSSAMVAYVLLWLSMALGLMMTNRLARAWPGGPTAFDLHQYASLLGLAFALFHALILLGDRFIQADLRQVLVPFAYGGYSPLWVGLGQVGIYLMAIVGLSFYVKGQIGRAAWRAIHFISFLMFALALAHGVLSGSDGGLIGIQALYWFTGGSVLFLTAYRILVTRQQRRTAAPAGERPRARAAE
jgi:predicted ferric reductase